MSPHFLIQKRSHVNTKMISFLFIERELLTPPISGLILPGITRQSILELAEEWNEFKVVQQNVTMSELLCLHNEKRVYNHIYLSLVKPSLSYTSRMWR